MHTELEHISGSANQAILVCKQLHAIKIPVTAHFLRTQSGMLRVIYCSNLWMSANNKEVQLAHSYWQEHDTLLQRQNTANTFCLQNSLVPPHYEISTFLCRLFKFPDVGLKQSATLFQNFQRPRTRCATACYPISGEMGCTGL